jgi:hypothetical protein
MNSAERHAHLVLHTAIELLILIANMSENGSTRHVALGDRLHDVVQALIQQTDSADTCALDRVSDHVIQPRSHDYESFYLLLVLCSDIMSKHGVYLRNIMGQD